MINKILIREEEKQIPKSDLADAVGMDTERLNNKVKQLNFIKDFHNMTFFNKNDVLKIFKKLKFYYSHPVENKQVDWNELLDSSFVIEDNGIFITAPSIQYKENHFKNIIKKYGIWDAQGLNNHEHIKDYTNNPALQLLLTDKLIRNYLKKLEDLNEEFYGRIVIYVNGKKDSTVCIYIQENENEKFLENYDNYLNIKKIMVHYYKPLKDSGKIPPMRK